MQRAFRAFVNMGPAKRTLSFAGHTEPGRRALNRIAPAQAVFSTMEEAWRAARAIKHAGHDHPENVEIHRRFAERPRPSDYPVMFWMACLDKQPLRVFDFGGNVGNLYYCYKQFLPGGRALEWTVYDIPEVLDQGQLIAEEKGVNLRFTGSLADAAGCDLFLVSGSLHYWEETVTDLLDRLGGRPPHVIVNRSPLRKSGAPFAAIQQTNKYCMPCLVRSSPDLIAEFAQNGYELVDQWTASELSLTLPLHPDHSVPAYSGLYFRHAGAEALI